MKTVNKKLASKIYVNSRIYEKFHTGIPYYIQQLFQNLFIVDTTREYFFLQTNKLKTLGRTKSFRVYSLVGEVLFDLFFILMLIPFSLDKKILHGPSNILPLIKFPNTKYVVTIHDLSFIVYPQYQSKFFNIYYRYAVGRSLKMADKIIAVSKNTKKDILKYYGSKYTNVEVIYPGVNSIFHNAKKKKNIVDKPYFLSLCTHPKRKNIVSVIVSFAENNDLSSYTYVIAGLISSEQQGELQEIINEYSLQDRVIFFGYAREEDIISLYQNAEFFIFPSFYEGFGFPVLEAMAAGCPVITANNSSLTEITPQIEWLVDPFSIADISDKMSKLVKLNPQARTDLINQNKLFVKKFNWSNNARSTLKIYNEL